MAELNEFWIFSQQLGVHRIPSASTVLLFRCHALGIPRSLAP